MSVTIRLLRKPAIATLLKAVSIWELHIVPCMQEAGTAQAEARTHEKEANRLWKFALMIRAPLLASMPLYLHREYNRMISRIFQEKRSTSFYEMRNKLPYSLVREDIQCYNCLMDKHREMIMRNEKNKIKHRFNYLRSIIGKDYEP